MKVSEIHKMADQELTVEAQRLRTQIYELRSQAVTEKLENPKVLGQLRKDVARLLTEQNVRRRKETAK